MLTLGANRDVAVQLYLTVLPTSCMLILWWIILISIVGGPGGSGPGGSGPGGGNVVEIAENYLILVIVY